MLRALIIILIHFFNNLRIFEASESVETFNVDINDILNEDLMPVSFFMQHENHYDHQNPHRHSEFGNTTREHFYESKTSKVDGNFDHAYSTMGFHRKKMNEYLCSSFVAKQILSEFGPKTPKLDHRLGTAVPVSGFNASSTNNQRKSKAIPNDFMLYDQGSTGYQKWLTKTTTLEDIYRQFADSRNHTSNENGNKKFAKLKKNSNRNVVDRISSTKNDDGEELDDDEYEEGDVTGFAIHKPLNMNMNPYINRDSSSEVMDNTNLNLEEQREPLLPYPYPTAVSKNGYFPSDHSHDGYDDYSVSAEHNHGIAGAGVHGGGHSYIVPPSYNLQGTSKEMSFKDFVDIATTTLAYLAFGMFILQVLMCITMNKSDNTMMMMQPMEAADIDATVEEIRRKRRSIEEKRIEKINEISRRVLISIDAVLLAKNDDGNCLQRILCENNKFARRQKDGQRIWMPVWSLALSWLAGRLTEITILECLKASIFGLGNGSCESSYSVCSLQSLKTKETEKLRKNIKNFNFEWSL